MLDLFSRPSSSASASKPNGGSASAGSKPASSSGIRIKTIVRKAPTLSTPTARSNLSSSSRSNTPGSAGGGGVRNALPEHRRLQIEREARERAQAKEHAQNVANAKARSLKAASSKAPARKKRAYSAQSDSESNDDEKEYAGARRRKSASTKSRGATLTPAPGTPRGANSNAAGGSPASAYKKLGRAGVTGEYLVPREAIVLPELQDESAELAKPTQSAELVSAKFGPYFKDLGVRPCVALDYPSGRSEEFVLLVPRDRDEYDPLSDLLSVVRSTVRHYLPSAYATEHFGNLDSFEFSSAAGSVFVPSSLKLDEEESSSGGARTRTVSPLVESGISTPTLLAPSSTTTTFAASSAAPAEESILRSLAKARNRRDGALFVRSVERYNEALHAARAEGVLKQGVKELCEAGLPEGVWGTVLQQCYDRTVGPRVEELGRYEAFSDNVYGELLPRFMSEISQLCKLGPTSTFVDLGSGVSNLALQVSLQTGATSRGVEMMSAASELGELQVTEAERRATSLWGMKQLDIKTWKGDFTACERTREALCKADVVLVNNYAFTAKTNERLSLLFLDLKDGAKIVSLKPFVPPDFRLTERTLDSPLAILSVEQRDYGSGCVSWAESGGRYFIHTVDRSMIRNFLEGGQSNAARRVGSKKTKKIKVDDSEEE